MTIAFFLNPSFCPVQTMHIRVDEKRFTLLTFKSQLPRINFYL
jgi:hypothetical protein